MATVKEGTSWLHVQLSLPEHPPYLSLSIHMTECRSMDFQRAAIHLDDETCIYLVCSESFRQLEQQLSQHLTEEQMFRIDHYLGKELIENLTVIAQVPAASVSLQP